MAEKSGEGSALDEVSFGASEEADESAADDVAFKPAFDDEAAFHPEQEASIAAISAALIRRSINLGCSFIFRFAPLKKSSPTTAKG